jgi:hypothetical protein
VRIRLRLNPNEDRKEEKQATQNVLKALDDLQAIFDSRTPQFHELNGVVRTLVDNAQKILKTNWDRVREGEPVYIRTKWGMFIFAAAGSSALAVSVIGYFLLRLFSVTCQ